MNKGDDIIAAERKETPATGQQQGITWHQGRYRGVNIWTDQIFRGLEKITILISCRFKYLGNSLTQHTWLYYTCWRWFQTGGASLPVKQSTFSLFVHLFSYQYIGGHFDRIYFNYGPAWHHTNWYITIKTWLKLLVRCLWGGGREPADGLGLLEQLHSRLMNTMGQKTVKG